MKLFGKIVILSWCLTLGSCVFAGVHAGDRDPLQWSSVGLFLMVAFGSGILNFIFSVVSTIPRKSPGSENKESETTISSDEKN